MTAPPPHDGGTLSMRLVEPFTRALLASGVDPRKLLEGLPLEPIRFLDPDGRISHRTAVELLERAIVATGDTALGIHAAEHAIPGGYDALEYVARSSGTLRGAVEAVGRFIRLLHDGATCTLSVDAEGHDVWELTLPFPQSRAAFEFAFAAIVGTGRSASGRHPGTHRVDLAFSAPEDASEEARFFGCPIAWGSGQNALVFEPGGLDAALAQANPGLSATLNRHAEQLLRELPASRTFTARVRQFVIAALKTEEPSAEEVAHHLKMSERTLRRRLQEDDTSLTDVISDVRRELSLSYLRDPSLSLMEIAFLLGFSNASAFHRAFRRWMNTSPSEYRRKVLG